MGIFLLLCVVAVVAFLTGRGSVPDNYMKGRFDGMDTLENLLLARAKDPVLHKDVLELLQQNSKWSI